MKSICFQPVLLRFVVWLLLAFMAGKPVCSGQSNWPDGVISGLQHVGAIHFYVTSSDLEILLCQKDATESRRGLTAILTGPDGVVYHRETLLTPETDPPGAVQSVTIRVKGLSEGVYTLLIISERSRHLDEHIIGFSTNASHYVINSGAAHVDSERKESIVFNGGDEPVSVFFKPVGPVFRIEATHLPEGIQPLELRDGDNQLVQTIAVHNGEAISTSLTNNKPGIWELRLPVKKGRILIEGLNHKFLADQKPLPFWATSRDHYFDLEKVHWLLDPRRFSRYADPGEQGSIVFTVFNNSKEPKMFNLEIEAEKFPGTVRVEPARLSLSAGSTADAKIYYKLAPDATRKAYSLKLFAVDKAGGLKTYALAELKPGQDNRQPVTLPIPLNIYEHSQSYFSYEPAFPRENQLYFDTENRPWTVTRGSLKVFAGNEWKSVPVAEGKDVSFPSSVIGSDHEGNVYTIVNIRGKPHLLRTNSSFESYLSALPEGGGYWVETWMGGQTTQHIPIVTRYLLNPEKKQVATWARVHDFQIFIPQFKDKTLTVGSPVLISDNCVGMSAHSGIPSAVASEGDLVYLVWGETSDPAGKDPGVPNYTSTYNRATGALSQPQFLAFSPPVNDVHNISSVLVDKKGVRHVIVGAHGRPFQHLTAATGSDQWTSPVTISNIDQTYVGAVLDETDRIHLFFRGWRRGMEFPGSMNAGLFYQSMSPGGTWSQPVLFASPGLNNYSIFYHRVTTDRRGRTYISFTYWPTWTVYRDSFRQGTGPFQNRVVLFSDNGVEWHLLDK